MRILLIEDDKSLCESISFQLSKEGFGVDVSRDGEEGLFLACQGCWTGCCPGWTAWRF